MNSFRRHLLDGARAARANIIPGIFLWTMAIAIIVSYKFWPPATAVFEKIAAAKIRGGYLYSALSTSFWAGIAPLLLVRLQPGSRREPLSRYPFLAIYWAALGVIIDAFYRLQAFAWGNNAHPTTLLLKIFCDLGLFTPIFAMPLSVVIYAWKDGGFRHEPVRVLVQPGWYNEHVVPVLLSCWMVWLPTLGIIYALPLPLQLPIQNLVECMWVLILMILTDRAAALTPVAAMA